MDRDEKLIWEPVETEHIVQDRWIDFRKSTFRMPDGRMVGPFYHYSRRSYAVILASDESGRFLCVRQFRQGIRQVTTEFPAGGIEPEEYGGKYATAETVETDERSRSASPEPVTTWDRGQSEAAALLAAKRELREETGYVSDRWEHLMTVPSNATITDNYAHIYRAFDCRKGSGLELDETEFLRPLLLSGEEIDDLIRRNQFQQSVHILGWLLWKQREEGKP